MDDAVRVRVGERRRDLQRVEHRQARLDRRLHSPHEVRSVDVRRGDEARPQSVERDDVRVLQERDHAALAREEALHARRLCDRLVQELHRRERPRRLVPPEPHLAHRAAAQATKKLVVTGRSRSLAALGDRAYRTRAARGSAGARSGGGHREGESLRCCELARNPTRPYASLRRHTPSTRRAALSRERFAWPRRWSVAMRGCAR